MFALTKEEHKNKRKKIVELLICLKLNFYLKPGLINFSRIETVANKLQQESCDLDRDSKTNNYTKNLPYFDIHEIKKQKLKTDVPEMRFSAMWIYNNQKFFKEV